ncbi:threonine synthase [Pedobacter montanisoli]|uniref:Threonine synthase n=1 Tax=Pedobacter montanisoli TaxID=2923277 RepID=A0ABS9ZZS9_9SPHI|nr:threonine synthase [Pedobacter montanisoli]MCJ0743821.1 threonine synthase [Pedobacter montanisoli]
MSIIKNYHLKCTSCGSPYPKEELNTFCKVCHSPIEVAFELSQVMPNSVIDSNERSMWRYAQVMPLLAKKNRISLGEGFTPILELSALANKLGLDNLLLKDESLNPTGSFKARGLSMAVSKAKELGVEGCIIPTAGNAGGALSAYCAKGGLGAIVVMPQHTPLAFKKECIAFGAELVEVKGLINDCAKKVAEIRQERGFFDISTMKEPYRLEGKKTLGYEIAEQLNWELPDVILYPTGGGTGLIGIWKAFEEMKTMGWIKNAPTRMIAVQAENCQPLVATYKGIQANSTNYNGTATIANGLAVPRPFAEKMMLDVLSESNGYALAVNETAIAKSLKEIAVAEGLLVAPEGAALLEALKILISKKQVLAHEKVLLLNTGSAYKYLDNMNF